MTAIATKVQLIAQILSVMFLYATVNAAEPVEIRIRGKVEPQIEKTSPYSLFFDPLKNGVKLDKQKIDYDLTKGNTLRVGPYLLDDSAVSVHMTREPAEFYEIGFGLEITRRVGSIYVISFRWPLDYISSGTIEILDDKAQTLWRRAVTEGDVQEWETLLAEQQDRALFERNRSELEEKLRSEKSAEQIEAIKKKLTLAKPRQLSPLHQRTQFGLAHKGFFEIPITQITGPFRFCLTSDAPQSRLAVCSRRYSFFREAGRYKLRTVEKKTTPIVKVNDKPVTLKGTAIFLDYDVPIKFAAQLESGTYFEFVSNPKEIRLVDMVRDPEYDRVNVIGYGDTPMGRISESFYADSVHWGFLNFMPTIGDLRKFWRGSFTENAPYLYLRGEGGAPFRQAFDYNGLPSTKARIVLSEKTTKSTYSSRVWVEGNVHPDIEVGADDAKVVRRSPTEFEWHFPAPERGVYNKGLLNVIENEKKWTAEYEIYRGYPAEISARMSGVLTNKPSLVLLGEIAGQYWFESFLGWDNYTFSKQRWGVSAKYFEAFIGTDETLKKFAVGNFDLKYRLTPGIWARDPTVGLIASALNLDYGFELELGPTGTTTIETVNYHVPVIGGGLFWARSMPKVFDDFFNLLPFMRYPKWVDWEFIFYPLAIREGQTSRFMFAMNFHGKVQWKKNFFGEAGFGLKNYSFEDVRSGNEDKHVGTSVVIAYGTVGLGFNF